MRINGKTYCDVCLKELDEKELHITTGMGLDDTYDTQLRHYCDDHRVWSELWCVIRNGESLGQLGFPSITKEKENTKEITNMEVYDSITNLFSKYYKYLLTMTGYNKDLDAYFENALDTDIAYERLKLKGIIKDEIRGKKTEN